MSVGALSLRDLEYVVAIAEHGHFGRAADACGVSQPALSAQLKKLEERLGVRIFERGRRVMVSEAGAAVVAQARTVLEEARKLLASAGGARGPLAGPLRLGLIATLGPYLLPRLLRPLRRAFPRLELYVREGLTAALLQELRGGALDAVVAAAPVRDPGLSAMPLFREPFLLALPAGHRLAAGRAPRAADLRPEEMVLLEEGHCLREQALELCPRERRARAPRIQATSLETLRHMVAAGVGYSLMPELAARDDLGGLVRYRRFPEPAPGRTAVLVWRTQWARAAELPALAELVRRRLPRSLRPDR